MGKLIYADELLKQMRESKEIGMAMFKFKSTGVNVRQGTAIALCKDCRKTLYEMIKYKDGEQDG